MEMTRVTLAWLVLSVWAMLAQSLELGQEAATIHSLVAIIQLLQGTSMTKLAEVLRIPAIRLIVPEKVRPSSGRRISDGTQTTLRQALDITCKIRDQVASLEAVQREVPDDIEIDTILLVTKRIQRDSCDWLAGSVAGDDSSICSEETLGDICFQWEALVTSEDAEDELKQYMSAVGITYDEKHSDLRVAQAASQVMSRYLSSQC